MVARVAVHLEKSFQAGASMESLVATPLPQKVTELQKPPELLDKRVLVGAKFIRACRVLAKN